MINIISPFTISLDLSIWTPDIGIALAVAVVICSISCLLRLAECKSEKSQKKLNKWLSSEAKFTKNVWGKSFMIFTNSLKNLIFKSNSVLKQKSWMVKASYRKNYNPSIFNFKMHLKNEKLKEFSLEVLWISYLKYPKRCVVKSSNEECLRTPKPHFFYTPFCNHMPTASSKKNSQNNFFRT